MDLWQSPCKEERHCKHGSGGSKKHGGPDLGPTRARAAWATLGVEGKSLFNEAPGPDFVGNPRLTVRMVARLQGFPDSWQFHGGKTTRYRQAAISLCLTAISTMLISRGWNVIFS